VDEAAGQPRPDGRRGGRLHVERGAVRRDDPARDETGLQLRREPGIPPERAQIEFRQRKLLRT